MEALSTQLVTSANIARVRTTPRPVVGAVHRAGGKMIVVVALPSERAAADPHHRGRYRHCHCGCADNDVGARAMVAQVSNTTQAN